MTIIHIETSTTSCSVAVSRSGKTVFSAATDEGLNHASMLSPFIQQGLDCLKAEHLSPDAIAVSAGPGSYTGLRIGVSTAKGLCYGYNIPLIALDTLHIMVATMLKEHTVEPGALLCPMIDARRMEVYTALFNHRGEPLEEVSAQIIDEQSFADKLEQHTIYFFGNGAEKCRPVIPHPNSRFIAGIAPLAENMREAAEQKFIRQEFVDTAYFEPFYLKEFQATTPKKGILIHQMSARHGNQ